MGDEVPGEGHVVLDVFTVVGIEGAVVEDGEELVLSIGDGVVAKVGGEGLEDMVVEDGVSFRAVRIQIEGKLDGGDGDHDAVTEEGQDPHALEEAEEGTEPALCAVVLESVGGLVIPSEVHCNVDDAVTRIGGNGEAEEGVKDSRGALTEARKGVFELSTGGKEGPEGDEVADDAVLRLHGGIVGFEVGHDVLKTLEGEAVIPQTGGQGHLLVLGTLATGLHGEAALAALSARLAQVQISDIGDKADDIVKAVAALAAQR